MKWQFILKTGEIVMKNYLKQREDLVRWITKKIKDEHILVCKTAIGKCHEIKSLVDSRKKCQQKCQEIYWMYTKKVLLRDKQEDLSQGKDIFSDWKTL